MLLTSPVADLVVKYQTEWDGAGDDILKKSLAVIALYCGVGDIVSVFHSRKYAEVLSTLYELYVAGNGHYANGKGWSLNCEVSFFWLQVTEIVKSFNDIKKEKLNTQGDLAAIFQVVARETHLIDISGSFTAYGCQQLLRSIILSGKSFEVPNSKNYELIKNGLYYVINSCCNILCEHQGTMLNEVYTFFSSVLTQEFENDWQVELLIDISKNIAKNYPRWSRGILIIDVFKSILDNTVFRIDEKHLAFFTKILKLEKPAFNTEEFSASHARLHTSISPVSEHVKLLDRRHDYIQLCLKRESIPNWEEVEGKFLEDFDFYEAFLFAIKNNLLTSIEYLLEKIKNLHLLVDSNAKKDKFNANYAYAQLCFKEKSIPNWEKVETNFIEWFQPHLHSALFHALKNALLPAIEYLLIIKDIAPQNYCATHDGWITEESIKAKINMPPLHTAIRSVINFKKTRDNFEKIFEIFLKYIETHKECLFVCDSDNNDAIHYFRKLERTNDWYRFMHGNKYDPFINKTLSMSKKLNELRINELITTFQIPTVSLEKILENYFNLLKSIIFDGKSFKLNSNNYELTEKDLHSVIKYGVLVLSKNSQKMDQLFMLAPTEKFENDWQVELLLHAIECYILEDFDREGRYSFREKKPNSPLIIEYFCDALRTLFPAIYFYPHPDPIPLSKSDVLFQIGLERHTDGILLFLIRLLKNSKFNVECAYALLGSKNSIVNWAEINKYFITLFNPNLYIASFYIITGLLTPRKFYPRNFCWPDPKWESKFENAKNETKDLPILHSIISWMGKIECNQKDIEAALNLALANNINCLFEYDNENHDVIDYLNNLKHENSENIEKASKFLIEKRKGLSLYLTKFGIFSLGRGDSNSGVDVLPSDVFQIIGCNLARVMNIR